MNSIVVFSECSIGRFSKVKEILFDLFIFFGGVHIVKQHKSQPFKCVSIYVFLYFFM